MKRLLRFVIFMLASAPCLFAVGARAEGFLGHAGVEPFIAEVANRYRWDPQELRDVFAGISPDPDVVRYNTPSGKRSVRSWHAYRARYVEPVRIRAGLDFWEQNASTLRRASERFGVPEEIIVSIIGVETIYGRNTGDFQTLATLATLSFEYTRRADFFKSELEQFLILAREMRVDPRTVYGSFSGAIGLGQFMPGSYRRYAVDFDGDGRIDLMNSTADAIGSIANFLAEHGWRRGEPITLAARVTGVEYTQLIDAGIQPTWPIEDLPQFGVFAAAPQPGLRAALIDLPSPRRATEFFLGLNNFYVITRYNRSSFYAMAVHDLAAALRMNRLREGLRAGS